MRVQDHLTIGELSDRLGAPEWRTRRAVDSLGVEIPRAGRYRLVPVSLIPAVEAAIGKRPSEAGRAAS